VSTVKKKADLEAFIVKHGCYSAEENRRIYHKWFENAPRYLFRAVDKKYGISKKIVCDAGCSYGQNLITCAPGSFGIEIEKYEVEFAASLGLKVFERDMVKADLSDLPKADVVWNSAVLEHVEAPHILLRKLWGLLKDDGLLALFVPIVPPVESLTKVPGLGKYIAGHRHGDHINAFTPSTLQFTCERAGFETIEVSRFYPKPLGFLENIFPLTSSCVYIGRKNSAWDYPSNSTRRKAENPVGFSFVGQAFPEASSL